MIDESSEIKSIPDLAQFIYEEAFRANTYYNLIQQYMKYKEKYPKSIDISPCFYTYSYYAYIDACVMIASRLFDKNNRRTIYTLKNRCDLYTPCFANYADQDYLSTTDISDYVKNHEDTALAVKIRLTLKLNGTIKGVTISNITPLERLEIFNYRLEKLAKCKENLRKYLNKTKSNISDSLPLEDIKAMIDLALEYSSWVNNILSNKLKKEPINTKDFKQTLKIVNKHITKKNKEQT